MEPTPHIRSAHYAWPREAGQQLDLNGTWQIAHSDLPADPLAPASPQALSDVDWFAGEVPGMVQWQWYRAGKGPHPYEDLNSKEYIWMEERAWWFRRTFRLPDGWQPAERYELLFDGVDHDARVWLDGEELGGHQGAFGGPVFNVTAAMRAGGEHELVVRLIPVGTGRGAEFSRAGRLVKPPTYSRWINNPDLMTVGLWRGVRLVATGRQRLERPFLKVLSASPEEARLRLEVELLAAQTEPWTGFIFRNTAYPNVTHPNYRIETPLPAQVLVEVFDDAGVPVFAKLEDVLQTAGRQWFNLDFRLARPRLWNPVGLGEPYLYRCQVTLLVEGRPVDRLELPLGVRQIEWSESAAQRVQDVWTSWLMKVNGQEVFLKGINWMPLDLLNFPAARYRWFLLAARNAGIQLLRVWGGGSLECDDFYRICDELGIMVMQDFPVNSNWQCAQFPLDVWEDQVMWTIFRLRSHPSLVVWCGGNEFDPYHPANAGVVGIMERNIASLDGTRPFLRASCDPGDVHPYPDCDTAWYWTLWQTTPAITEWGSHALPTAHTLGEIMPAEETARTFGDLTSLDEVRFTAEHPVLRNHWAEFGISRVPKTISRAALLADVRDPSLEDFVEAVQLGAGEVYTTVIRAFRTNYPVTTLVMPWVYNRPWPSVGMQMVDHSGRLTAGYYAMKASYRPDLMALVYPYEVLAPGELMPVEVRALHDAAADLQDARVEVVIYSGCFEPLARHEWTLDVPGGTRAAQVGRFDLQMPDGPDTSLLLRADLLDASGRLLTRSIYWVRTSAELADAGRRAEYRAKPVPGLTNATEGRVKPLVSQRPTRLNWRVLLSEPATLPDLGQARRLSVEVSNRGQYPAAFIHWHWAHPAWLLMAEDNYFWLEPGETRRLDVLLAPANGVSAWEYDSEWREDLLEGFSVAAWNSVGVARIEN